MSRFNLFRLRRRHASVFLCLLAGLAGMLLSPRVLQAQATDPEFVLYDDALAPDWEEVAYRARTRADNSAPAYSGTHSLLVNYSQGDSYLLLRTNMAVYAAPFEALRFAVYGADARVGAIAVTLFDGMGNPGSGAVIVDIPAGRWSVIEIPLSQLGSPAVVGGIRFAKMGDTRPWPSFYLDEIGLLQAAGAASPTPTASASTPEEPATATPTSVPPTATATNTAAPAPTLPPPTATPPPPAATPPPPTATPPPPTATTQPPTATAPPPAPSGIWISAEEIAALPASGAGWERVLSWAQQDSSSPNLGDQEDQTDAVVVAKALVYVKTGESRYRQEAVAAIMAAMGTEDGGRTLALARNLAGYVVAADLVGLSGSDDAAFRAWLDAVRYEDLSGRTLISTHEDRPNNWGTHAGASRIAAALYLGDTADLQRAADVFRGWLGDRSAYTGFRYGELSWQANPSQPVGINAPDAIIEGHNVDGVLPDDQRRAGSFTWPPPAENYVWEALQGAVAQARMLSRHGYDAFGWSDRAILRAVTWLHEEASFPATGDDESTPWLINGVYGSSFPAASGARPAKNGLSWYEWFYQR
jgi:hypothetical protein